MSRIDRARQFMPFSPLDGYDGLINQNKKIFEERKELSDEQAEFLSRQITAVKKGDMITVKYYENGAYINFTGIVSNIDYTFRKITIIKTTIPFDDIFDIKR